MRELIFVDTETTGLDPKQDQLVELSYSRRIGTPRTLYFGVQTVPPFVDDLIGFTARGLAGKQSQQYEIDEFLRTSENATMVAANPGFDKGFLEAADLYRFHYRMLDIESYAMAKLGLNEMPGMKDIYNILTEQGHTLPTPNHTAAGDVKTMLAVWRLLNG